MRGQGHIVKPYMMAVRQQYKCCTCPPPLQLKLLIHRLVLPTHRHVGCDEVQGFSIHKGAEQGQDVGVPAERGCREGGRGEGVSRKMVWGVCRARRERAGKGEGEGMWIMLGSMFSESRCVRRAEL